MSRTSAPWSAELYFDGLAINRSQDNFVVQWGDPDEQEARSARPEKRWLPSSRGLSAGLSFTALPIPILMRRRPASSKAFPPRTIPRAGEAWLAHCYGMIGAGRDNDADSGGGTELYVVTGHAPRQLDRNITLIGRVVQGMELLSIPAARSGPEGF